MHLWWPRLIVLIVGFLAAAALFLLLAMPAQAQALCSRYASATGSGNACSEQQPCKIGTFLANPSSATPGSVLCLLSGVYKGEDSMLTLTSVSGTEGHPITFRAKEDGSVTLDGQFGMRPLDCAGNWLTVQGVDLKDANDTVMAIRGQHCTIQRVVAYSTQSWDGIENVVDIGGSHNLLEDFAAFGYARKMVAMGARGGPGPNTIRRGWVEHNGSMPGSAGGNPTNAVEIGYDQMNGTIENVIARRNILSSATSPEAPFTMFSTANAAILGSISYVLASDTFDTWGLATAFPEGGSHVGSGNATRDSLIQDLVLYVDPTHTATKGFAFYGDAGSNNRARNIVAVSPQGGSGCSGSWTCENIYLGTTLEQALPAGKTIFDVAPGVCREYKDRVLTDTPLWPWKMQARIDAALARARMPSRNVTQHVQRTLGTIPTQCRSDTPPPEPEPTPPGPHAPLVCTGTVAAVPGQVAMRCIPEAVRR